MFSEGYIPSATVFADHPRAQYQYFRASDAEFARRHARIRAFMDNQGLDCLLIAGGTGTWDRGWLNTRWAVNHVGCQLTNCSYVVFPREGDITVLVFPINAWLPARRAREIVEDIRAAPEPQVAAVQRLRELECTTGRIGIVESDLNTSIPSRHLDHFRAELPAAELRFVTRDWWRKLRMTRSAEEIAFMECAAQMGDAMSEAVEREIRPGMSEGTIFGCLTDALLRNGGEIPTMVLAASGPTFSPCDTFQRERPLSRVLSRGDVILTELAPRYPDGSECQTGRSYFLGQPAAEYERMGAVMLEAYDRVVEQMRPGQTDRDVVAAGRCITDAGYIWLSPLIHGAEGGAAGALPIIGSSVRQAEAEPFVFGPNMVVCVEIHVGKADHSAGLFMADAWVTTDGAPRCLNHYKRELIRI